MRLVKAYPHDVVFSLTAHQQQKNFLHIEMKFSVIIIRCVTTPGASSPDLLRACIQGTRTNQCPTGKKRRAIMGPKVVYVCKYKRFRFGRWEDVCKHKRSLPNR